MVFVKYEIQKHVDNDPYSGLQFINTFEKKVVDKKEYLTLKDWELVRKKYFLITPFSDYWVKLSTEIKMTIITGIIVPIILGILSLFS